MSVSLFEGQPGGVGPPRRVTLVRLSSEIARSIASVGRVGVEGEVHRPTTSRSGWIYFTLRDRAAQIEIRVPSANARRCRAIAGERVCVVGVLQWVNERGQVQLLAEEVTPIGEGAIAALVAETRRLLEAEGLIGGPPRPVPLLPDVIGVVCGSEAAVRRDIESVIAAQFPGYPVVFEETTVSGAGAQVCIVEAIQEVARRPGVEVVILARGGGDAPSLLPWSSEEVCRAVAACPVPVVSAIGHESDHPLCDEVADLRFGTPSLAATAVVPDQRRLGEALERLAIAAADAAGGRVEMAARRLSAIDVSSVFTRSFDGCRQRLALSRAALAAEHPSRRLDACRTRLAADWRRPAFELLGRAAGRLDADGRHLRSLSPARTLERGYAVVTRPDGSVVRDAGTLRSGDEIGVQLARGGIRASVCEVTP